MLFHKVTIGIAITCLLTLASCSFDSNVSNPVTNENQSSTQNKILLSDDFVEVGISRLFLDGSTEYTVEIWPKAQYGDLVERFSSTESSEAKFLVMQELGIVAVDMTFSDFEVVRRSQLESLIHDPGHFRREHDIDLWAKCRIFDGEYCWIDGHINAPFYCYRWFNTYIFLESRNGASIDIECRDGCDYSGESEKYIQITLEGWIGVFWPPIEPVCDRMFGIDRDFTGSACRIHVEQCF